MRQEYVRKRIEGNPHGFVRQVPLATISLSATELPADIAELLSTKELARLEKSVIAPARLQAERKRKEQEALERDPNWRLSKAIDCLQEAGQRAQWVPVDRQLLGRLHEAVVGLGPVVAKKVDPLDAVTVSVQAAIAAIEQGVYGHNPGPVRKDAMPAKKWTELRAVLLENEKSLLSVLQEAGWVVKRERASR